MTNEKDKPTGPEDTEMRSLLKRSFAKQAPSEPVLRNVQRKIRERSKGKFYADGWSTTQARMSYALIAVAMLIIVAIAFLILGPMGFTK